MSTHPRSHTWSSCICKAAGQVGRQSANPSIPLSLNCHSSHPRPLENSRSCILIVADASLLFKWSQKPRVYINMYLSIYLSIYIYTPMKIGGWTWDQFPFCRKINHVSICFNHGTSERYWRIMQVYSGIRSGSRDVYSMMFDVYIYIYIHPMFKILDWINHKPIILRDVCFPCFPNCHLVHPTPFTGTWLALSNCLARPKEAENRDHRLQGCSRWTWGRLIQWSNIGVSIVMGDPKFAGWFMSRKMLLKWMMTGGTPILDILDNLQMSTWNLYNPKADSMTQWAKTNTSKSFKSSWINPQQSHGCVWWWVYL